MLYKDQDFSTLDAIRWDDLPHIGGFDDSWEEDEVVWNRVRDEFPPDDGFTLWGPNDYPSLHDLR